MKHVFLSHNSADKPEVIRLARALMERGVQVWLDVFELKPGDWWGSMLKQALEDSVCVLACIGEHGVGPWHERELEVARQLGKDIRVVCLPGWTKANGWLGFDTVTADSLHLDWDGGVAPLAIALKERAPAQSGNAPATPGGPFDGGPYPGIHLAYEAEHAAWFFGREHETAELIAALREHRWVWFVGNSGSGKSSVARAGVMACWPKSGSSAGVATVFEPSAKATQDLAGALGRACEFAEKGPVDVALHARNPSQWSVELRKLFGGQRPRPSILVVVDQAEQIFAERGLRGTCEEMMSTLWALSTDRELPVEVHVLVVLRADWLHRALREPSLKPLLRGSRTEVTLGGMDGAALRQAITIPARRAGGGVDPFVIKTLVEQARDLEHGLPLLQFVLREAWKRRTPADGTIRPEAIGTQPLKKAVGHYVREQRKKVGDPLSDQRLDALVLALVELDDRGAPRRKWVSRTQLEGRWQLEKDLDSLVEARLVVSEGGGPRGSLPRVNDGGWKLAHEAVLTAWPEFTSALERRKGVLQLTTGLGQKRQDDEPLRGLVLAKYESLINEPSLTPELREFLKAWIARRTRRRRLLVAVLAAVILALSTVALVMDRLRRDAVEQRARGMLATATAAKGEDPLLQTLLLVELPTDWIDLIPLGVGADNISAVPVARLPGAGKLSQWSTDGTRILTASRTARMWNADGTGEPVVLPIDDSRVETAMWSPDGTRVLAISGDMTARVWDVDGIAEPVVLDGDFYSRSYDRGERWAKWSADGSRFLTKTLGDHQIWNLDGTSANRFHFSSSLAELSPDGTRILIVRGDRVELWDIDRATEPVVFRGHGGAVASAEWSRDATHVLTSSADHTARVWRTDDASECTVLTGHQGAVHSATWDPDEARILTASRNGTVRIWREDGTGPIILGQHESAVRSARWSPDGFKVVTASADATARVWRADGSGEPIILRGHRKKLTSAEWSPDGSRIFSVSEDREIRVWAVPGTIEPVIASGDTKVESAEWSPDGTRLFITTADGIGYVRAADWKGEPIVLQMSGGTVRSGEWNLDGTRILSGNFTSRFAATAAVWDVDGLAEPLALWKDGTRVQVAEWDPKGVRVFTASTDGRMRVWSADAAEDPVVLPGPKDDVIWAEWSPGGARILTVGRNTPVRVWTADGSRAPTNLEYNHRAHSARWSPDGALVATVSDGGAHVWDVGGAREPVQLRGSGSGSGGGVSVEWSPDGSRILVAMRDKTVRIWGAKGNSEPVVFSGHDNPTKWAKWSPDGARVVTVGSIGTKAKVWNAMGTPVPVILSGHDGEIEWVEWSPDGSMILTASRDETARVWRADGTGDPIVLRGHKDDVIRARWSRGGTRVLTLSRDATARVWTVDPKALLRRLRGLTTANLTPPERQQWLGEDEFTALATYREQEQEYHRLGDWPP